MTSRIATEMKIKQRLHQDGSLVDLSDQGLTKLELPGNKDPVTIIADRNSISRIDNLEQCQNLRQLSLAGNRLIHVNSLSKLRHLAVLNLPQNSIVSIEGLRDLTELQWLNLSGNSIKSMDSLASNIALRHLDLADNSIAQLGDIHLLTNLKTLLLHGNSLTSLKTAPHFLPKALVILSLAENEILDINEVSFISFLADLQQLSIMNNPCVLMTASDLGFDYRPFVVNWCPRLQVLDGYMVTEKEILKAEWLYSQGKGHHFKLGQHVEAVQYLSNVCPLTASVQLESSEDAKLSKILHKQRYHQQQLQDQRATPPHHWNVLNKSSPQGPDGDSNNISPGGNQTVEQGNYKEPVRAWAGSTSVSSVQSGYQERSGHELNDLSVQDVTSEDYEKKSTSSLLDSESTYLPVDYIKTPVTPNPSRPMTAPTVSQLSAPATANFMEFFSRPENRPATAIGDNKYDAYDKRPIKPLNQEMYKGLFKPDFNVSQPQLSGNEPVLGTKKRTPPTAQAMDYDTSQDSSQIEQVLNPPKEKEKENIENIPATELNITKNAAEKKVRKTSQRTKTEDKRNTKVSEKKKERTGDSHVTGAKTSIPVAKTTVSRTQSDYIPGKYSTSRRPATTESDTRTKGKLIKTIPEKVINSSRLVVSKDNNNSLRDSGIYSRPTSDAVLAEDVKAATKIQSFWRGYWAREHDVDVVRVRREIRARRAEEHIVVLRSELESQRKLYEQERQLRTLQLEAIRQLWKEVQSLQAWKSQVLSSQNFKTPDNTSHQDYSSYNYSQEIQNTLARAEMINNMDVGLGPGGMNSGPQSLSTQSVDLEKQKSLEKTCESLQTQVSQLQEALHSMSSIILQGSLPGSVPVTPRSPAPTMLTPSSTSKDPDDEIVVTDEFDDTEVMGYESLVSVSGAHWGSVPHSLSPYPSEEEEAYFRQVPQPGFPTPPRGLKLEHRGNSALVLRWQASKILDGDGKEVNKPLLGYRVFVNDKPKAMIAGTKQKALIEGLDPSLTYKIYVKAVSPLGESNSSDVVMAALSKGQQKRRSSSSDSNHSESDKESTASERRSVRKDRKGRKTKSPRSSRRERLDSSRKEAPTPAADRPGSRLEQEAGVIMTPKLHTHKRTRSKDLNKTDFDESLKPKETLRSPTLRGQNSSTQESQGFSFDSRKKIENGEQNDQNLSSTFTIDSQNSVLLALSSKSLGQDVDSADSVAKEDSVKGHRRRRSKDMKGEISDSSSSVSSVNMQSRNLDLSGERNLSGTDSPSARRRRSREGPREETESHQRNECKTPSAKISPTAGSQGVPVIDGRKRHGSGSRPSSPACSDISDSRSLGADRKRLPVGEVLEQRFSGSRVGQSSSSTASSATLTQSQVDNSINDLPPQIPRRDPRCSSSMENLSSRVSCDYNRSPTEKYSPTGSERRRTSSTSSETDLSGSNAARQLDMDKKTSNTNSSNSGIVAKLLQKLQTFSKNQEESLRTTKYKRKPGDSTTSDEERVQSARKTSGDSDISDAIVGKAPVHSDSSSGAHSDDQQAVRPSYRTHRRTASDHRPIRINEQPSSSPSIRSVHSPVIMDGAKSSTPQPTSSNNIKRHASFHGILPSKKEDLVRSGSHENLTEKNSQQVKQQNIDITVPTTPTRRHRHRSRSRSPAGTASPHVPIISAAQLQRQSKAQVS